MQFLVQLFEQAAVFPCIDSLLLTLRMNNSIESEFLNALYSALHNNTLILPTLPDMALTIRDMVADEECSLVEISRAIKRDPALSARLIQLANSPLLRASNGIDSVEMAVMRMGGNMIRNIVTSMVMEQLFQATTEITDRKLRSSWLHATEVSSIAVALSYRHTHLQADQAMLAGLVHDIGILPILTQAEDYPLLLEDEPRLDQLIEQAHCAIGKAILEHWQFPPSLIKVAAEHENIHYDSGQDADYADLVLVANLQSTRNSSRLAALEKPWNLPAFSKLGVEAAIEEVDISLPFSV